MEKTTNEKVVNYYVKNKDLLIEIRKMNETGVFNDTLGKYVLQIVNGLSHRPNFNGYTYIDEMRSEATLAVVKGLKNFNLEKYDNPFAYITQIAWHAFIAYINKEKTKSKTKQRLFDLKEKIEDDFDEFSIKAIDYSLLAGVLITEEQKDNEEDEVFEQFTGEKE